MIDAWSPVYVLLASQILATCLAMGALCRRGRRPTPWELLAALLWYGPLGAVLGNFLPDAMPQWLRVMVFRDAAAPAPNGLKVLLSAAVGSGTLSIQEIKALILRAVGSHAKEP